MVGVLVIQQLGDTDCGSYGIVHFCNSIKIVQRSVEVGKEGQRGILRIFSLLSSCFCFYSPSLSAT